MKSKKFVPNVISAAPKELAKLIYLDEVIVSPGAELNLNAIKQQPKVTWNFLCDSLYTLLLVNPDAQDYNQRRENQICHWLVVNIPENHIDRGQTLVHYNQVPHCFPISSHRFILLIFLQSKMMSTEKLHFQIIPKGCISVKSYDYLSKYSLGKAVAWNYFKIKN